MISNRKDPPDGGWGWICVIGKLYCYLIVVGTTSAFGIIYIDLIDYFNSTREVTAWIGSLSFGLTLLTGPLSSALTTRFGIQKTVAAGTLLAFTGCFISFFATGITYLYVSYGVLMGIGLGLILVPCVLIVVHYFKGRLGLANAIGSTGNGVGTLVLPPLYTYLLEEYGWRGTMLLLSGCILNCFVCAIIFVPPPHSKVVSGHSTTSKTNTSTACRNFFKFFCTPYLILYTAGTALVFLGYIVPYVHLPDMAIEIGMDKYQAASLISIMGVSNIVGRIIFGWISDLQCTNVVFLQGVSLLLCGVSTAVCPLLNEFYAFAVYSVIYGTFIGVFLSLLPIAITVLVGLERTGDVLGLVLFLSGIMDTVASPAAGWLFDSTKTYNASFYVAACPLFLAGMMNIVVMVLHRRQKNQRGVEKEMSVQTVSEPYKNANQNNNRLEQTYM